MLCDATVGLSGTTVIIEAPTVRTMHLQTSMSGCNEALRCGKLRKCCNGQHM